MRILITAGPTREYIDAVRFITNASSGQMGYALAAAATAARCEVTLLSGPVALKPPAGCRTVPFVSVGDLAGALAEHFPACDVLVMAAAVGDFTVDRLSGGKLKRSRGPVSLQLQPTEDLLAACGKARRPGQRIVAFAVEDGTPPEIEAKAQAKLLAKGADYIVANPPSAIAQGESLACVLSADGVVLPWAERSKEALAAEIVRIVVGK
ncbi:MAG: phosphopantothenoylcysteine decarboxylase [Phycisphaerae bacterium]|jgi:phosphopantothenoylcysteine decarboxylase/phosphopantothenate--cysteine ligase